MGLQLVIRKQALAVERADDIVDGVLQQDDALALIGGARQHVIEEQHLAERRRHFGDENRVVGVHERLMRLRQHRVHRVPHLVRQRKHRIERVVVVQQHVRMHAVHRRRIRAAALARVFVHVDPAPLERLPDALLIVGAERLHGLDNLVDARSSTAYFRSQSISGTSWSYAW